jgi:hypothetical protein
MERSWSGRFGTLSPWPSPSARPAAHSLARLSARIAPGYEHD